MCDITLCADHATISDGNFAIGHAPPGDGMHLVLQEALGTKRARYYLLTGTPIDAVPALELGSGLAHVAFGARLGLGIHPDSTGDAGPPSEGQDV
ncbi:enoyl-CoA hydratase-related protein [Kribbella sp. NBC_01505]|uniref:enoyl-CoA hydratase-related protein n=1 Tax=Kribbella sp. NBC_01505 TaxID=2903580 RepID=UPI00386FD264